MRKFVVNCDFGGRTAPFTFWLGNPKDGNHPLHHQSWWLGSVRGGSVPSDVMKALTDLQEAATEQHIDFLEYFEYATEALAQEEGWQDDGENIFHEGESEAPQSPEDYLTDIYPPEEVLAIFQSPPPMPA